MLKAFFQALCGDSRSNSQTDLIEAWIKWRESGFLHPRWSENTKKTYVPYLKQFLNKHQNLTAKAVAAWLSAIPQEQQSKRRHNHSALSSFARFQMEMGKLDGAEYQKIRELYPRRDKYRPPKQLIITEVQLETLIKAATQNQHRYQRALNRALLLFLSETGLRVTEACRLKLEDLRFSDVGTEASITVRCGKGGRSRLVTFSRKAQKAVKEYLKHRPTTTPYQNLFLGFGPTTGFQPLTRHAVARRFQHISQEVRIPFTAHSLRHYRITEWGKRLSSSIVQKLAGHSSLLVTERYLHIQEEEAIAAAFE